MLNLYRLKISNILMSGLFFGLVVNAYVQFCCNSIRILFAGILILSCVVIAINDIKIQKYIKSYTFLFLILCLGGVSLLISETPFKIAITALSPIIVIFFAFFAFKFYDKFKKWVTVFVYINFIALIFEMYTGAYLFNIDPVSNYFQIDRLKGIFSYSKEAGSFLIFSALLLRDKKNILYIILVSAAMTGSRSAMVFVFLITLIEGVSKFYSIKSISKSFLILSIAFFSLYLYFLFHEVMWIRLVNSFDFDGSSGHQYRFFIWNEFIKSILNYDFAHFVFGNLAYTNTLLGNGAENAYLTVMSNNGLLLFLIYFFPIFIFSFLSAVNFRLFYPFILLFVVLFFGRQGLGWSDGILLWAYIYHIFNSKYFSNLLFRINKGRQHV
jgi:hypothetical protein